MLVQGHKIQTKDLSKAVDMKKKEVKRLLKLTKKRWKCDRAFFR